MQELLRNFRFTIRSLLKKPAFSLITVMSLGLGIGCTAAVFSIVNTVLIRPLLIPESENVVRFRDVLHKSDGSTRLVNNSVRNYLAIRDQSKAFQAVGAHRSRTFDLLGSEEPEQIGGLAATASALPLLGIEPIIGRLFNETEDTPGAPHNVAVLSHDIWRRHYGESEDILGQEIVLNDTSYTVLGVLPPRYRYPYGAQVWIPMGMQLSPEDEGHYLQMVGRIAPDSDAVKAQVELDTIAKRLQQEFPDTNKDWGLTFLPVREDVAYSVNNKALLTLLAASAFLLFIACANAANMLLARSLEQSSEMALRTALGASRKQLFQQMTIQGIVLGLASGLVGICLAFLTLKPVVALSPLADIPMFADSVSIDLRVLTFTFVISLVVGLVFSLIPALKASRPNLQEILKEETRSTVSNRNRRLLQAFVVLEVAIAVVLLIGAGLMVRNLQQIHSVDLGFDDTHQMTMRISLPEAKFPQDEARINHLKRLLTHLRSVPGIEDAQVTSTHPLERATWGLSFRPQGFETQESQDVPVANLRNVSAGYIKSMGIPLLHGRDIIENDTAGSQPVVVVSKRLADRFWPGESAVGKQLRRGRNRPDAPWHTIVGVTSDVEDYGDLDISLYFPQSQQEFLYPFTTLVIRTRDDANKMLNTIRKEIWIADPTQSIAYPSTARELFAELHGGESLSTLLFVIFASLGLLLATLGIYGILTYLVQQRRHEIGLRIALGASPRNILGQIVSQGMKLATIGLVAGTIGAVFLTRLLRSQLEDIEATDPKIFVAITLVALLVAAIASVIPAQRATSIDPVKALRSD